MPPMAQAPLPPSYSQSYSPPSPLPPLAFPDRFEAKTWIHSILVVLAGLLALAWLGMGLAFLTGAIEPADGRPGRGLGAMLSVFGLVSAAVAALGLLYLRARSGPVLRLYREGIEFNLLAESGLESIPLLSVPLAWCGAALG